MFSNSIILTLVGNGEEDNLSLLINSAGTSNRNQKFTEKQVRFFWTLHYRIIEGYLRIKSQKPYSIALLGLQ